MLDVLMMVLTFVAPDFAPVAGGTHATIIGEEFRAPARVFFGDAEARVLRVDSDRIEVIVPPAAAPQSVAVRVESIIDGTTVTAPRPFRYADPPAVHSVTPDRGPSSGGTEIVIRGEHFEAPLSVAVAGRHFHIVQASDTEIVAIAPPLASQCEELAGGVDVMGPTGWAPTVPTFTFEAVSAAPEVSVDGVIESGGEVDVQLLRGAHVRFEAVGAAAKLEVVAQSGSAYRLRVGYEGGFGYWPCWTDGIYGTRPSVQAVDLRVEDVDTHCSTTVKNAFWIRPPQPVICALPPQAIVSEECVRFTRAAATQTITISNRATRGTKDLHIYGATVTGPFSLSHATATIAAGQSATFTVELDDDSARAGEIVFTTDDRDRPLLRVCLQVRAPRRDPASPRSR
jgi:hypothetical protein